MLLRFTKPLLKSAHFVSLPAAHRSMSLTSFHLFKSTSNDGKKIDGVPLEEFKSRRESLAKKIVEYSNAKENSKFCPVQIVIVPSAKKQFMVDGIPYFFRQSSDLRYLTGHKEPDSLLLMKIDCLPNNEFSLESHLFLKVATTKEELWEGPSLKTAAVPEKYGIDEGRNFSSLLDYLRMQISDGKTFSLWYDYIHPQHSEVHRTITDLTKCSQNAIYMHSSRKFLHELRLIKSPEEQDLMRDTCKIAALAIRDTICDTPRLSSEAQAFASVDYHARMKGADFLGYPPVVAYGLNAQIIHYTKNNQDFGDRRGLLLMDAGTEKCGYTSDITRVWPVGGRFSPQQKAIYESVLSIQGHLIKSLQENLQKGESVTVDDLYVKMLTFLGEHLIELGLVSSDITEKDLKAACMDFCPHHVSHYLGMDVHDTSAISRNIPIQAGMVLTIEPAIYVSENGGTKYPSRSEFQGIGIRIEDDILIQLDANQKLSCEVLTYQCPKTVKEIENLMS